MDQATIVGVSVALCNFIAYLVASTMGLFGGNKFPVEGKTVLLTGGSQGMGLTVAKLLAAKGANVVIVARGVEKLKAAVGELQASAKDSSKQKFSYISADLRSCSETERMVAKTTAWNGGLAPDVVWCVAGNSHPGFFVDTAVEVLRDQMDTVYWSAAYTARAALREWLKPVKSGSTGSPRHLIFTSSVVAFFPLSGYSPYSPAKAAMRSLADTLEMEVEMYNGARKHKSVSGPAADIKVHTIFPMGILTPGYDYEESIKPGLTKLMEESDKPQTPEEVAQASLAGLEAGESMITTAMLGRLMLASSMSVSPRSIGDVIFGWVAIIVAWIVGADFRSKSRNWGTKHGLEAVRSESK